MGERLRVSQCGTHYPDIKSSFMFGGCTVQAREQELQKNPQSIGLPRCNVGCLLCGKQTPVDLLLLHASRHPSRVHKPEHAELFLVPISLFRNEKLDSCPCRAKHDVSKVERGYETRHSRTDRLMDALRKFRHWRRVGPRGFYFHDPDNWRLDGLDGAHMCSMSDSGSACKYMSQAFYEHIYRTASWGLEVSKPTSAAGCAVTTPLLPKPGLFTMCTSFEAWS